MLPALAVFAVVIFLPAIWFIAMYNRLARIRQHMRESWAGIDVELKRRYDLIPNLVQTVKGYARHEQETLQRVIELRNQAEANTGTAAAQAVDESALMIGLQRLFVVSEAYPDLKSNENFLALQKELSNTEDRIAASRRFFNANVRELNQLCEMFPTSLAARMFGFQSATYFELESKAERVVPKVEI
jgi:LemA protein